MHSGGSRRRGKPRTRILYWFRTPPGVRVGRSALDPEAIKLIEEHNPDVEFDWTRILKGELPERRSKERDLEEEATAEPAAIPIQIQITTVESVSPATEPSVAEAKLGAEGLARLRARHAELLARIAEGIADPVRKDELIAQAERLNPDTWVTNAEVAAGLESYEATFETLRAVVGRRRKRRRSRKPRANRPGSAQPTTPPADVEEERGDAEDVEDEEEEI